jgi:hypothetical protein
MKKRMTAVAGVALTMALFATSAFAAKAVKVTARLSVTCPNCATDVAPDYSLLPDNDFGYPSGNGVKSEILTNNSVYTLDTTGTLVNGLVGGGTRTILMHFYSPVEGVYANNVLPACWNGDRDQEQAVNWSVFASNSQSFPLMQVGVQYPGWARMDFNVRNGSCDNQIFRYYMQWYGACIVRKDANTWEVTSDSCGRATNYGEVNLRGQGGKSGQTVNYGDWRMPFKLTLIKQE